MYSNFTVQDILGIIVAFSLYPFIFVFPGYVVGWILDLFDFRGRTNTAQLIMGIAFSSMISPTIFFFATRFFSSQFAIVLCICLALLALAFSLLELQKNKQQSQDAVYKKLALLFVFLWLALSILTLVDLQIDNRLYFSNNSYDLTTRVAVVDAITRTGVPPVNPSYFPGHPVLLNFLYYYWYILASLVEQMGGKLVSAQQSMIASIGWAGIILFAAMATYLRVRDRGPSSQAWRKAFIAIQLFTIGGLDFIMVMLIASSFNFQLGKMPFQGNVEGWNMPIMSWMNALAWVPHHLTAATGCVLSMPLLFYGMQGNRYRRLVCAVIIGFAFASAVGLSVWVMFLFGIFWVVWGLFVLVHQRKREQFFWMLLAGLFALIFAYPFMRGILSSGISSTGNGAPLALYVRPFIVGDLLDGLPALVIDIVNFISLPLNYLFEFGFYFPLAFIWIQEIYKKKGGDNPVYQAEFILVLVSIFTLSFLRSNLIAINDLGIRGWLPMQFILVVWSADVVFQFGSAKRWLSLKMFEGMNITKTIKLVLAVMMVIGMLTMGLEFLSLRAWSILVDMNVVGFPNNISPDTHLGERTYSARLAYDYLSDHIPSNVITQNNPLDFLDRPSGLYGSHQMAISNRTAYGVPVEVFDAFVNDIGNIFMIPASGWDSIDMLCEKYSIDVLIVKDTDLLWDSLGILKTQRLPLYENKYYALYPCGKYAISK